jgi:hypothetical protein
MVTHVMVDLETMGTGHDATITQIGAVAFTTEGLGSEFAVNVDLESSRRAGLRIDASSLTWWMGQEGAARESWLASQCNAAQLEDAILRFNLWLRDLPGKPDGIWSHGSTFDLPILRTAYDAVAIKPAWHYRDARDTRTLFWLCKPFDPWAEPDTAEVKHNALDDARRQARAVVRALNHLRSMRGAA